MHIFIFLFWAIQRLSLDIPHGTELTKLCTIIFVRLSKLDSWIGFPFLQAEFNLELHNAKHFKIILTM